MTIGIVGAMFEEIAYFLEKLENIKTEKINNFTFYTGQYLDKSIVLVESGIGKVFAGVLATTLISSFKIDLFINVGVAGGLVNKIEIGDVVIADKLFFSDVDVTSAGNYVYGQLPKCPPYFTAKEVEINKDFNFNIIKGDILTSDKFITDIKEINDLKDRYFNGYNILACDMESTAFSQVCYFFGIEFLIIRSISDVIGHNNKELEYNNTNLQNACLNSSLVLDYILSII